MGRRAVAAAPRINLQIVMVPNATTWGVFPSLGYPAAFSFLLALLGLVPPRPLIADYLFLAPPGDCPSLVALGAQEGLADYLSWAPLGDCPFLVVHGGSPFSGAPDGWPFTEVLRGGDRPVESPEHSVSEFSRAWGWRIGFLLLAHLLVERQWFVRPSSG